MINDPLPPLRDIIELHKLSAKKNLGQNFLLDLNLTRKIARQAGTLDGCDILEIGPGPGGLSRAILENNPRKLLVIERDDRCLPALQQIAAHYHTPMEIRSGDALALDVSEDLSAPVKIIANLPYNIGTELLVRWLTPSIWPPFWQSLTLMFQKEVAERIVAQPGSKSYGRLSILAQWRCDVCMMMEIPPQAFWPPPKVTSAVVHFDALPQPRFSANAQQLNRVVAAAFGQRRKMLRASLKSLCPNIESRLISVDIDPTRRAETLSIEEFCRLSNSFSGD